MTNEGRISGSEQMPVNLIAKRGYRTSRSRMGSNAASYVGPCPTESLRRWYKEAKKQGLVTEPGKGAGCAGAAGAGATKPAPAEPAAIGSLVPGGPNGPWPGRLAPGLS